MARVFTVYGPYEVPIIVNVKKQRCIDTDQIAEYFSKFDGIAMKQGCYIFALRAGRGYTPWYVGKATKSFRAEIFQDHKLVKYNDVLFQANKGTPVIFLVAPESNKKAVCKPELSDLEKGMIQSAFAKNQKLTNIQNTKNIPQWSIKGVIRSSNGKPTQVEASFKKMMGI